MLILKEAVPLGRRSSSAEYGKKGSLLNMIALLYHSNAVTDNDLFEVMLKNFEFGQVALVRSGRI